MIMNVYFDADRDQALMSALQAQCADLTANDELTHHIYIKTSSELHVNAALPTHDFHTGVLHREASLHDES